MFPFISSSFFIPMSTSVGFSTFWYKLLLILYYFLMFIKIFHFFSPGIYGFEVFSTSSHFSFPKIWYFDPFCYYFLWNWVIGTFRSFLDSFSFPLQILEISLVCFYVKYESTFWDLLALSSPVICGCFVSFVLCCSIWILFIAVSPQCGTLSWKRTLVELIFHGV